MSPDPITLGPGEFQIGQNIRNDNGIPTVRDGIDRIVNLQDTSMAGTPNISSSNLVGYWEGYQGNAYRRIGAIVIGAATHVYDLLTGAEITAASGQWGNTRFTNGTNIQFAVVADQLNNTTKLVACNGVDAPRVIYNTGTTNWVCATHVDAAMPDGNRELPVRLGASAYLQVRTASRTTYTDSGVNMVGSDDSARYHPANATTGNACKFTFTTSLASGDYSRVRDTGGAQSLGNSRQVWIGIESEQFDWIDSFQVSLLDNGADESILWDPANPEDYPRPIPLAIDATNKIVWMFSMSGRDDDTYDQVSFTYKRAYSPTVAGSFWCFMVAFGGTEPGGTLYATSQYNPYSHAESPGVVYREYIPCSIYDCGGPAMNGLRMLNVPEALFYVDVQTVRPASASINTGYSTTRFYSMMAGQDQFYLVKAYEHSTYSGGWSTVGGWSATQPSQVAINNAVTPTWTQQLLTVMPDAFHKCIPTASVAPAFGSSRLLVGAASTSDSATRYDTLWVSTFGYPYRFRKSPRLASGQPVEESAFTVTMPGESIKRSITTSAGGLTGTSCYVCTDSSIYGTSGNRMSQLAQIRRVSPYGLTHEFAVAEHDGAIAWASTTGHILYNGGGQTIELSSNAMEDQIAPITISATEYVAVISMAFRNGKLYVARRTTSAYQTQADRILVYDFRDRMWVSDDVLPTETPCFMLSKGEGGVGELVLNIVGRYARYIKVYEYDTYGLVGDEQDAGVQDIAWAIKTRDFVIDPDAGRFSVGRVAAFATADASTIAVERSFRPDGVTGASTIDIASSASQAYGIDSPTGITSTPSDTHLYGCANAVKLSGSHPARFQIFHAFYEAEEKGDGFRTEQ